MSTITAFWRVFLDQERADINSAGVALGLIMMNVVLGPGAKISAVFYWRESSFGRDDIGRQRMRI